MSVISIIVIICPESTYFTPDFSNIIWHLYDLLDKLFVNKGAK